MLILKCKLLCYCNHGVGPCLSGWRQKWSNQASVGPLIHFFVAVLSCLKFQVQVIGSSSGFGLIHSKALRVFYEVFSFNCDFAFFSCDFYFQKFFNSLNYFRNQQQFIVVSQKLFPPSTFSFFNCFDWSNCGWLKETNCWTTKEMHRIFLSGARNFWRWHEGTLEIKINIWFWGETQWACNTIQ